MLVITSMYCRVLLNKNWLSPVMMSELASKKSSEKTWETCITSHHYWFGYPKPLQFSTSITSQKNGKPVALTVGISWQAVITNM